MERSIRPRSMGQAIFSALVILSACASETHPDWPGIKRWIREEFPGAPTMTVAQLRRRLGDPDTAPPILLDARSSEEYAVSHLERALSAPTEEAALSLLASAEKDDPVVVYCSVGYRSAALTVGLRAHGFTNVTNLEGSMFEWANEGLPVYRDGLPVGEVHPFDADWGRLLHRNLWPPAW